MFYGLDLSHFPKVTRVYSVTRKTVWQVADPYNIFIYVEKGNCLIEINGEEHIVGEGSLFFIPESQSYKRSPVGDSFCTMTYIHFKSGEVTPLSVDELKGEIIKRRDSINKNITNTIVRLIRNHIYNGISQPHMINMYLVHKYQIFLPFTIALIFHFYNVVIHKSLL